MKQLKVILIGAGQRGTLYTDIMKDNPEWFKVVGVAEPRESRRLDVQKKHNIPDDMCFSDYRDILALPKMADIAIVSTMDRDHFDSASMAMRNKYDILLEKPVCPTPDECLKLEAIAKENGVKVVVCHVLRYTPFFNKVNDIIKSGAIGDIVSINHEECVGNIHQSHSFVRGRWGNEERSSFMLLQKSCHDIDILQWLLNKKCKKVSSFGGTYFFKRENAPENAPDYCIEGCPAKDKCDYNAVWIYYEYKDGPWYKICSHEANPTEEMALEALRTTQYGKCVFKCDNTVVDHQTVNMEFEDGVTVTFTMNAFNKGGRFIHVMGTKGELRGDMTSEQLPIKVFDFKTRETIEYPIVDTSSTKGEHGGGDVGIIKALYEYMNGTYEGYEISEISTSVANHIIVFAAEKARHDGVIIDLDEYTNEIKKQNGI